MPTNLNKSVITLKTDKTQLPVYFRDIEMKNHKFGLIYQAVGDTTEKELFQRFEHSERMDKFMEMLGTKVDLAKHSGYSGGLHHFQKEIEENGDEDRIKSGVYSLYTEHNKKGVMFHVSTLLPTTIDGTDKHQIAVTRTFCKMIFWLVHYIMFI